MSVDIGAQRTAPLTTAPGPLQRLTSFFVRLFERYTPDPYILAVGLTILTGILAASLAPKGSLPIAQRIRIDFGWLVGAAYSGWMIFSSGFSSSIALSQATPGSSLNIVQKITGQVLPLESMLFTPLNLVTTLALFVALPLLFCAIQPRDGDVQIANLPGSAAPETAATAMGVANGEQVADMIQPFWALPVVAVAGISIRRVMGFTVMSFLLGVVLFGTALLIFV